MDNKNGGAELWKIEKLVGKGEYLYAIVRNHPNANTQGYVLAHRIVAENMIGRLLYPNEVVHHVNGDKKDNRPENLQVMDKIDHHILHRSTGRTIVYLKCPWCKNEFVRERKQTFLSKHGKYTCCSRSCNGKFSRYIQLNGETQFVEMAISENILMDNSEQTNPT